MRIICSNLAARFYARDGWNQAKVESYAWDAYNTNGDCLASK
jgi:hypothetical protein